MRPRSPDRTGFADHADVRLGFEIYGAENEGIPVVFLSAFCIIDSRLWNMQVPYFARRRPCVVYDPPGAGNSDKPADPARFTPQARVDDALAVMDAAGFENAVVVGTSQGGLTASLLAAFVPERVKGMVVINPTIPLSERGERRNQQLWDRWLTPRAVVDEYEGFVEFFTEQVFSEPYSSIGFDDAVAWGMKSSAESVLANLQGGSSYVLGDAEHFVNTLERIECPSLVIQAEDDRVSPPRWGLETAAILGVEPVIVEGGCHGIQARRPVQVNRAIEQFLRTLEPHSPTPPARATGSQNPRMLYLSSPIGLGHVRRDTAIADELRALVPDLQIEWLAQPPVTRVLEEKGETIHPASAWLASESAHVAEHQHGHELHALAALRDMSEILAANFFVFQEAVESGSYDLVVGDEAWDVDHFWHERPAVKATRFAWLTDMVGIIPIPDKGTRDEEWATEWNAQMLDHVEGHPEVRDASLFIGDPEDVLDVRFGPGLPSMREWTRATYEFSGYVTGFDPESLEDRDVVRERFGVGPDETLCVASVGGAGVGQDLLETVVHAHVLARRQIPALRTLAVAGPRLDPGRLPAAEAVDRLGYVRNLHHLLAAADLAVVQGGLTTTMELTAAKVPFLYAPLESHWEQQFLVHHRLRRHRAGHRISHDIERDELAGRMVEWAGASTHYRPLPADGAARAARRLRELL